MGKPKGETLSKYLAINKNFDDWMQKNHPSCSLVEVHHIQEYMDKYKEKDTNVPIAALKTRFNLAEGKNFQLDHLKKKSNKPKPHHAIKRDRHEHLYTKNLEKKDLRPGIAYLLMLDLGCRPQDLKCFKFNSFVKENGLYVISWYKKKTKYQRTGIIQKRTYNIL